jgi:hypothetical protein
MLYLEKPGLLFTHVSRTGGVSIRQALLGAFPDGRELLGQHAALADARPLLGARFDQVFKFAVVRNPWERMASWYALVGLKHADMAIGARQLLDPGSAHWRNFDTFLTSWLAETCLVAGVRRRRMSQWGQLAGAGDEPLADAVLRYESLEADLGNVCARAGIGPLSLDRFNASHHAHYSRYYSAQGRRLVADAVPEDIEHFGYRFEEA